MSEVPDRRRKKIAKSLVRQIHSLVQDSAIYPNDQTAFVVVLAEVVREMKEQGLGHVSLEDLAGLLHEAASEIDGLGWQHTTKGEPDG